MPDYLKNQKLIDKNSAFFFLLEIQTLRQFVRRVLGNATLKFDSCSYIEHRNIKTQWQ